MYRETTRCRHPSSECPNTEHCSGEDGGGGGGGGDNGGTGGGSGGDTGDGTHEGSAAAFLRRTQSEASYPTRGEEIPPGMQNYCGKRKYSMIKFGYHLAVPLARRSQGGGSSGGGGGETQRSSSSTPHVIALVGLPARGKTYIARKLSRYLNWIGINTKVFNLGEYRRQVLPGYENAEFFRTDNEAGMKVREQVCHEAIKDVIRWFREDDGEVAVFDATNTTRKRRRLLYDRMVVDNGYSLFFVESICNNKDIIENNIKEVKVMSPDYARYKEDEVVKDFCTRIKHYEGLYETLDESVEDDYSFLKIFNAGEKVLVHKHEGHIQSRIVYYLMNVHITPRTIYLTRHGESDYNVAGRIGGDAELTRRGVQFSKLLAEYVDSLDHPKLKVWTSWMSRTIQTTKYLGGVQERWKALNEIDAGQCDGMTYGEIKDTHPHDFVARDVDKFAYRYPRGESYEDLVARLEPVIMELERQDSVLLVSHQAVIRCLLGYYLETAEEDLPWQEVPLHTVIKLEPIAYGCKVQYIKFPVNCVSTHRKKPSRPGFLSSRYRRNEALLEGRESDEDTFGDALARLDISDRLNTAEEKDEEEEEDEDDEEDEDEESEGII